MDFATASRPWGVARSWPPVARADASGSAPDTGAGFPAPAMQRLKQRADFLAATAGAKTPAGGFVLQARDRHEDGPVRVGFTVSKKVGNAVERNRVRRRLREMVRLCAEAPMQPGHDYVLIGRRAALQLPFERLAEDFARALGRVHGNSPPPAPHAGTR